MSCTLGLTPNSYKCRECARKCNRCGWDTDEAARRMELIRAGKLEEDRWGARRLALRKGTEQWN